MAIAVEHYGSQSDFIPFHLNQYRGISPAEAAQISQALAEKAAAETEEVGMLNIQAEVIALPGVHQAAELAAQTHDLQYETPPAA